MGPIKGDVAAQPLADILVHTPNHPLIDSLTHNPLCVSSFSSSLFVLSLIALKSVARSFPQVWPATPFLPYEGCNQ